MYPVALRDEIRTWVLLQGKSQRAAARHFGLSRNTVAKLLEEEPSTSVRQYQHRVPHKTPVRDAALAHIQNWLQENEQLRRWAPKQCWTAHRMWVELRKLGIPIGESTVRLFVRELHSPRNLPTSRSTLRQVSGQSLTLVKRASSWVTGWSKSLSWPDDSAFREQCLSNASPPSGKKPFCSVSATPSSSGEACHAWPSTTTSNQQCCKS